MNPHRQMLHALVANDNIQPIFQPSDQLMGSYGTGYSQSPLAPQRQSLNSSWSSDPKAFNHVRSRSCNVMQDKRGSARSSHNLIEGYPSPLSSWTDSRNFTTHTASGMQNMTGATCYPDQRLERSVLTTGGGPDWTQLNRSNNPSPHNATQYSGTMPGSAPWQTNPQLNIQVPPFDSQAWNDMILSAMDNSTNTPYSSATSIPPNSFPYRISPGPSPSPSPVFSDSNARLSPASSSASNSAGSRRSSTDQPSGGKQCSHCHATSTPLWRREPTTLRPLCNACGLYLQQRNKLRPQELIDADTDDGDSPDEFDPDYAGPECSHCRTHNTSVWRRSKTGEQLCNACGVYLRLRGKPRPLSLKKNRIKPRSKHPSK